MYNFFNEVTSYTRLPLTQFEARLFQILLMAFLIGVIFYLIKNLPFEEIEEPKIEEPEFFFEGDYEDVDIFNEKF